MVRGNEELNAAAAPWVAVRVTDMRDVDLSVIRFDFDLTFAAVLMHAGGTIYHRYGGRTAGGRAVKAAGLQKNDVVVAFAGKRDFQSVPHWHAWVALTPAVGTETEVVVLREGKECTLRYRLPEQGTARGLRPLAPSQEPRSAR